MAISKGLERINGVIKREDADFLRILARQEGVTFSRFIRKVLEEYIEMKEDLLLAGLAEKRKKSGGKFLTAEELIKELDRPRGR